MKTITFFVFFACTLCIAAQNIIGPQPESWSIKSIESVDAVTLQKPDLTKLIAEDRINDLDKSIPWRFGYDHFVDYGIANTGKWTSLSNGDRIWRANFISPGALSMNLIFDQYHIPQGARVYVYNDDKSEILNTFTHLHNNPEGILGTWLLGGESIWIEYFEPKKVAGTGSLHIANIIHGYRTTDMVASNGVTAKALNDSGACNVDVNCNIAATSSLANDIKNNVKKSVGMVVVNGGTGICTGALVNNTNNDGKPYFLTANHCLGGSVNGWAFRFNWASDESVADCATTAPSVNNTFLQTTSGALLRSSNSQSDFALLELTDTAFFNGSPDLVWAGWNRSTTAVPTLNVGVHHPSGDIQKVCVDLQGATRTTTSFNGNASASMWRIADWDLGVTEPGSSGSPLFNQDGLIIGKLSGGSAACSGTVDNGGFDIYGRFGVSWDFSAVNSQQLKFWLDPAGTNPVTLAQFPALQVFDYDAATTLLSIPATLCSTTISPTIQLKNAGNVTLTSATISYSVDRGAQTSFNWTGSLAIGQTVNLPINAITITAAGDHSFTSSVSNPNGITDQRPTNDSDTINFTIPDSYVTNIIRIGITLDRYGDEITWELRDSNNVIVSSGGPYQTTGTNGTQAEQVTNVTINNFNECYTLIINDSYGDGLCCLYGAGTFQIRDSNNAVLFNGDGSFGSSTSHTFKVSDPLSVNDNERLQNISVYPNPFTTEFSVTVTTANLTYDIVNITGQRISSGTLENGTNNISMKNEAAGMYFINITDGLSKESISKKLIKQ